MVGQKMNKDEAVVWTKLQKLATFSFRDSNVFRRLFSSLYKGDGQEAKKPSCALRIPPMDSRGITRGSPPMDHPWKGESDLTVL